MVDGARPFARILMKISNKQLNVAIKLGICILGSIIITNVRHEGLIYSFAITLIVLLTTTFFIDK